jgi:hypothetical protein
MPFESTWRLRMAQIYDVASWAARVPVDLALPLIVRSRVKGYLDDLPLDEAVRARVVTRVDSEAFVDEIIPFVLALRDTYTAPGAAEIPLFDTHLRERFGPGSAIPGFEHAMFRWKTDPETGDGFGLSDEMAAQLVSFYDALYLRGGDPASGLEEQLACASRGGGAALRAAADRAEPAVRQLLQGARADMEESSELGHAVDAILKDAERLETVTAALIQFIDGLVCKHYRAFAVRVAREQQLGAWLAGQLAEPRGGALWDYLAASGRRRHAVLIAVDGLQGHLMEALAGGAADDPFLAAIAREQREGAALAPPSSFAREAPAQQTRFLEHIAGRGYHHAHYLPFFKWLYRRAARSIARVGISTTPTISVRNLPMIKTGATVAGAGGTGIPNFHFVDRTYRHDGALRGRPYYFYGNDAVLLPALAAEAGMRTLHERLETQGTMSCMAQYDERAHAMIDPLLNLALGEKLRDFGERLCLAALERRADREIEARKTRRELLEQRLLLDRNVPWYDLVGQLAQRDERALAERTIGRLAALEADAMPELLLYYNPWPDHFAHFTGPFADEILAPSGELNRLDYWLGRIAGVYRRAGISHRTLFAMAGDHGLSPVFQLVSPDDAVFGALRKRGIDFRVVKISSDEGEGPKLTNPFDPPSMKGIDVVIASTAGGNFMLDLFRSQGDDWAEQPLRGDLAAVRPIAQPEAPAVDLVAEIAAGLRNSLDYLVVRDTPWALSGGRVLVLAPRGEARHRAWITRREDRIHVRVEGEDVLGLSQHSPYAVPTPAERAEHARLLRRCLEKADVQDVASWCDESTWRRLTGYTARPDSVVQLAHLYDSERAGTINLFPRAGIGYNSTVPGRHAGESFHEKDAFVGAWGKPLAGAPRERLATAENGSMALLVYEYLTGETARQGEDGWGFPSLRERLKLP